MIVDTGILEQSLADVRRTLDHRFLNHINDLGPPTLENLARFIWDRVQHAGSLLTNLNWLFLSLADRVPSPLNAINK